MASISSETIAAYIPRVTKTAQPLVRWGGAELDDLVQEGLISVWHALEKGVSPSQLVVQKRLLSYIKWLRRQTPRPYEDMLPLNPESFIDTTDVDGVEWLY